MHHLDPSSSSSSLPTSGYDDLEIGARIWTHAYKRYAKISSGTDQSRTGTEGQINRELAPTLFGLDSSRMGQAGTVSLECCEPTLRSRTDRQTGSVFSRLPDSIEGKTVSCYALQTGDREETQAPLSSLHCRDRTLRRFYRGN